MNNKIFICQEKEAIYPNGLYGFSPSERYPEYKLDTIAKEYNGVYAMVRECLHGLDMDNAHYGTPEWNPLGDIIRKGDHVVIKPNMVKHENPAGDLDCLITNVSVVRAVVDYVLLALDGTGKITIGDAPVQTCDFDEFVKNAQYNMLQEFYQSKGISISIADFRGTVAHRTTSGALVQESNVRNRNDAILVDMGRDSMFYNKEGLQKLRITNYPAEALTAHHNENRHEYLVSREILEADVIINLPKPKTHRKAGITGALKNMVGINVEKEYLPHHTQGSKEEGGDEYPKKNYWKKANAELLDRIDAANHAGKYRISTVLNYLSYLLVGCNRIFCNTDEAKIREGSWYGNDTIWRTVNDLNRIVLHCDRLGNFCEHEVRKVFTLADMIVSGEGEGPLAPTPTRMGIIVAGFNSYDVDCVITSLMGINVEKVPTVSHAIDGGPFHLMSNHPKIDSNEEALRFSSISQMDSTRFRHVKMPSGWRDYDSNGR